MGDRTALQLTVYRVEGDATPVANVLDKYGLLDAEDEKNSTDLGVIGRWSDYEANLGAIHDIARELIEIGGVSFMGWQDPVYEWMGTLVMYTPSLGRYENQCDASGNVLFTDNEVRHAVDLALTKRGDVIESMLGKPWFDELALTDSKSHG